jgi:hypothetical protein
MARFRDATDRLAADEAPVWSMLVEPPLADGGEPGEAELLLFAIMGDLGVDDAVAGGDPQPAW